MGGLHTALSDAKVFGLEKCIYFNHSKNVNSLHKVQIRYKETRNLSAIKDWFDPLKLK